MQQSSSHSRRVRADRPTRSLRRAGVVLLGMLLIGASAPAFEPEVVVEPPASENGWELLEPMTDGFRAWLPGPTRLESSLRDTIAGQVAEKKYFGHEDGRSFVLGFHVLPKLGKWFAPTSLVLSQAKKNVLATNGGRELSFERRRMNGHPGGVLKYEPVDETADFDLMEVHLVLVGRRLYVLKASHAHEGVDRTSADRFFDSFEVIP